MPRFPRRKLVSVAAATLALVPTPVFVPAVARALPPGYSIETVHANLAFPVALAFAPDRRLFYLELQTGRVMVYSSPDAPTASVWATVPTYSASDQGLLGMAFHPSFPDSPYVYLFHTNPSPLFSRVVRLTDQSGVGIDYTVLRDSIPAVFHNGGRLAFGPDGMLYVTYGDQSRPQVARDPSEISGKILRLLPIGQAAPDNPWGATNPAALVGIRNSFGICFDSVTGIGYFTDNGDRCDDELNIVILGGDYGWGRNYHCGRPPAGTVLPLLTLNPPIAPTGCVVYGAGTYPGLNGNLFFGGWVDGAIRRVVFKPGLPDQVDSLDVFAQVGQGILDLTVGPEGWLWFTTQTSIMRIAATLPPSVGDGPRPADSPRLPIPSPRR